MHTVIEMPDEERKIKVPPSHGSLHLSDLVVLLTCDPNDIVAS